MVAGGNRPGAAASVGTLVGDRRANACKAYLIKIGVAKDKIETISKGSLEAKEKGSAEDMSKDRRGALVVVKP